jgi:MYND finger
MYCIIPLPSRLHCIVLDCPVLDCIVHCTALHTALYYAKFLHFTILHNSALNCFVSDCTELWTLYTIVHCIVLHCTVLNCTIQHCTVFLYCTALRVLLSSFLTFLSPLCFTGGARVCFVCSSPSVQRCSKCNAVYYCGQRCQLSHWSTHKKVRHSSPLCA